MNKKNLIIRAAKFYDLPQIFKLQQETWLATYPNEQYKISVSDINSKFKGLSLFEKIDWYQRYLKRIYNKNTLFLLCKNSGRLVGYCEANKKPSQHRIFGIYIHPSQQKSGLGSELLQRALDWLGEKETVYLNVAIYNDQAINFYHKFGFRKAGPVPTDSAGRLKSGAVIPEIEMLRRSNFPF